MDYTGLKMLQKLSFEDDSEAADRGPQFRSSQQEPGQSHLLELTYYWQLVKRRALYFIVPFVLVLPLGLAVAVLLPATYVSEGKILVQSQQIPTELVRPTVTSAAQERIQVIEQRTMTRENGLGPCPPLSRCVSRCMIPWSKRPCKRSISESIDREQSLLIRFHAALASVPIEIVTV